MPAEFVSAVVLLLLVTDPFGNVPLVNASPDLVDILYGLLAIPFIAGPSALATVMLMATREPAKLGMWALAITVSLVLVTVILLAGERLQRLMGDRLMQAIERLMGLILTAMAVEMLLAGIRAFVQGLK